MAEKRNVLILESDKSFAMQLAKALKGNSPFRVTIAPSVREACLHLVEREQNLAFIPAIANDKIIRSLRAIQPDLRLILMTPDPEFEVPAFYSGKVQAVLIKSLLDVDLPDVLRQAGEQPFHSKEESEKTGGDVPDTALLIAALQQAELGQLLQSVIFAGGTQVLAHWGDLNDTEVANVALHVGEEWLKDNFNTRVQFLQSPPRAGDWLLYTTCLEKRYLLTLAALPEMPLTQLRRQALHLTGFLVDALRGVSPFVVSETAVSGDADLKTYAIVWRPLASLPASLHIPLRRALERLAAANGCRLQHTDVQADLIHLVVACPGGRDSTWAAYLFKNGAEEIIQQEFGVTANLWETGYYASESTDPLSEAELNIFLEHDK